MCPSDTSAGSENLRPPSEPERALLGRLLGEEFAGREALLAQLPTCLVTTLDENGSLRLSPATGHDAQVLRRVPVEAEYSDGDGVTVHVLLHVVDGHMNELEIYREDSGRVLNPAVQAEGLDFLVL